MTLRPSLPIVAGLLAAMLLASPAAAQTEFDLSPEQPGRIRTEPSEAVIALIPADYDFVQDGFLTVAVTAGAVPIAGYATDAATVIGADPDVALLIADKLGLELNLVSVAWPDWPLGVSSGRYDTVISNVTVTEERKDRYDFATYRQDVLGFYVPIDSEITEIGEPADVAGLRIITGSGTNQESILLEWNRINVEAGLPPVEFQYYDDTAASALALASGRADANFNPNSYLAYEAAVRGETRLVGIVSGGWPLTADIGAVTNKSNGLGEAIAAALNELIEGGEYQQALARWNLEAEAIEESQFNPPGLPRI